MFGWPVLSIARSMSVMPLGEFAYFLKPSRNPMIEIEDMFFYFLYYPGILSG